MSHNRENSIDPPSPHSSGEGFESLQATPDTRMTVFSPRVGPTQSLKNDHRPSLSITGPDFHPAHLPDSPYTGPISSMEGDPFVAAPRIAAAQQKLSPTASTFRPLAVVSPNVPGGLQSPATANLPVSSRLSTDLGLSRCIAVSSRGQKLSAAAVEACLKSADQSKLPGSKLRQTDERGDLIYMHFSDIRDAHAALGSVRHADDQCQADYISALEFSKAVGCATLPPAADSGQVVVVAFAAIGTHLDDSLVEAVVQCLLQSHGALFAFQKQASFDNGAFRALVEFCDQAVAASVVANCTYAIVNGIHIIVSPHSGGPPLTDTGILEDQRVSPYQNIRGNAQNLGLPSSTYAQDTSPSSSMAPATGAYASADMALSSPLAMCPVLYQSPFPGGVSYIMDQPGRANAHVASTRAYPLIGPVYHPALQVASGHGQGRSAIGRPDSRRHSAARVSRAPFYNLPGHHNHVDVTRIREGTDVRTTIMLRNIPNKVDQAMLKRIVDESSWGKYDFMYLRIDFANDCNVGYAFINFVDPLDIVDFANTRGNQRWNCFKSDKVAEISYATIQGKDCLVQKFRNSSVMLEALHYRPKLYFTTNGPKPELAGQEEPFPKPDNQSKMKRSCENAEHVGLFTPNAGQHFREEQRRRRSQFDRGTRLAALEEFDYETAMQHLLYSPQ